MNSVNIQLDLVNHDDLSPGARLKMVQKNEHSQRLMSEARQRAAQIEQERGEQTRAISCRTRDTREDQKSQNQQRRTYAQQIGGVALSGATRYGGASTKGATYYEKQPSQSPTYDEETRHEQSIPSCGYNNLIYRNDREFDGQNAVKNQRNGAGGQLNVDQDKTMNHPYSAVFPWERENYILGKSGANKNKMPLVVSKEKQVKPPASKGMFLGFNNSVFQDQPEYCVSLEEGGKVKQDVYSTANQQLLQQVLQEESVRQEIHGRRKDSKQGQRELQPTAPSGKRPDTARERPHTAGNAGIRWQGRKISAPARPPSAPQTTYGQGSYRPRSSYSHSRAMESAQQQAVDGAGYYGSRAENDVFESRAKPVHQDPSLPQQPNVQAPVETIVASRPTSAPGIGYVLPKRTPSRGNPQTNHAGGYSSNNIGSTPAAQSATAAANTTNWGQETLLLDPCHSNHTSRPNTAVKSSQGVSPRQGGGNIRVYNNSLVPKVEPQQEQHTPMDEASYDESTMMYPPAENPRGGVSVGQKHRFNDNRYEYSAKSREASQVQTSPKNAAKSPRMQGNKGLSNAQQLSLMARNPTNHLHQQRYEENSITVSPNPARVISGTASRGFSSHINGANRQAIAAVYQNPPSPRPAGDQHKPQHLWSIHHNGPSSMGGNSILTSIPFVTKHKVTPKNTPRSYKDDLQVQHLVKGLIMPSGMESQPTGMRKIDVDQIRGEAERQDREFRWNKAEQLRADLKAEARKPHGPPPPMHAPTLLKDEDRPPTAGFKVPKGLEVAAANSVIPTSPDHKPTTSLSKLVMQSTPKFSSSPDGKPTIYSNQASSIPKGPAKAASHVVAPMDAQSPGRTKGLMKVNPSGNQYANEQALMTAVPHKTVLRGSPSPAHKSKAAAFENLAGTFGKEAAIAG